jgi:hypothetical protein
MRYEVTAIGGGNARFTPSRKTGVFPQQSQRGIFHQLLGVGTVVVRDLR